MEIFTMQYTYYIDTELTLDNILQSIFHSISQSKCLEDRNKRKKIQVNYKYLYYL